MDPIGVISTLFSLTNQCIVAYQTTGENIVEAASIKDRIANLRPVLHVLDQALRQIRATASSDVFEQVARSMLAQLRVIDSVIKEALALAHSFNKYSDSKLKKLMGMLVAGESQRQLQLMDTRIDRVLGDLQMMVTSVSMLRTSGVEQVLQQATATQKQLSSNLAQQLADEVRQNNQQIVAMLGEVLGSIEALSQAQRNGLDRDDMQRLLKASPGHRNQYLSMFHEAIVQQLREAGLLLTRDQITYNDSDVLGCGGFATVYSGTVTTGAGDGPLPVAVKVLVPSDNKDTTAKKLERDLMREAYMMMIVCRGHPGLVQLHGVVSWRDADRGKTLYALVVDRYDRTLEELSRDIAEGEDGLEELTDAQRLGMALQVARAVNHMHYGARRTLVHGDIKPSNVLVRSGAGGALECALSDFGSAGLHIGDSTCQSTISSGYKHGNVRQSYTAAYAAPEVLEDTQAHKRLPSDVYCLGGLMYHLWTGHAPFVGRDSEEVRRAALARRLPATHVLPPGVRELVDACWRSAEAQRPTATQAVKALEALERVAPDSWSRTLIAASLPPGATNDPAATATSATPPAGSTNAPATAPASAAPQEASVHAAIWVPQACDPKAPGLKPAWLQEMAVSGRGGGGSFTDSAVPAPAAPAAPAYAAADAPAVVAATATPAGAVPSAAFPFGGGSLHTQVPTHAAPFLATSVSAPPMVDGAATTSLASFSAVHGTMGVPCLSTPGYTAAAPASSCEGSLPYCGSQAMHAAPPELAAAAAAAFGGVAAAAAPPQRAGSAPAFGPAAPATPAGYGASGHHHGNPNGNPYGAIAAAAAAPPLMPALPPQEQARLQQMLLPASTFAAVERFTRGANRTEVKQLCDRCGGIAGLVALLRVPYDAAVHQAAWALSNLALSPECTAGIVAAGGIESLVALLRHGPGFSAGVQEHAAAALRILACGSEERSARIAAAGAIEPLVALLGERAPRGAKEQAAAALGLLAYNSHERCERMAAAGAIQLLVAMLRPGAGTPLAQEHANETLNQLAYNSEERKSRIAAVKRASGYTPSVSERLVSLFRC